MGCCCAKHEPVELSDGIVTGSSAAVVPSSQPPRPPAKKTSKTAKPAAAAACLDVLNETPKSITSWSTDEVGEWLGGPSVDLGQYRETLAAMGVDGFMLSRMEPEDLEDAVPVKADRLAIVNAAKEELAKNGPQQSGARTDYGKVLGHDRND